MKKFILFPLLLISFVLSAQKSDSKMEWFADAKLGIFIHWGIYSVNGISESWGFFNNYISQENYMKQLNGFTAENYHPKEWIELIKESGAKYAVITSKHHDGISLWDTKAVHSISTKNNSAAKRDLLTPFITKLKKSGLKTGIYFSLPDWSHPFYDIRTRTQKRYDYKSEPNKWNDFINYYQSQLKEISKQYNPDLLWFDGDWEHTADEWKSNETIAQLRKSNPKIIINSRLDGKGDYATPEQGIPVKKPKEQFWELCYTMNDSWGYQPYDNHYKSANMIIRTLIDCIAMGGNLLLDISPKADGSLPEEQIEILKELGRWTKKYEEAVYGTVSGVEWWDCIEKNSFSKDKKTMYIYLDRQKDVIEIEGFSQKPRQIRWLGSDKKLNFDFDDGDLTVYLKDLEFDPVASVVAIDFDTAEEFEGKAVSNVYSLSEIISWDDSKKAIREIVKNTAWGENMFRDKINDDASFLDPELNFKSETVKNWVKKHAEVLSFSNSGIDGIYYYGKSALSSDKKTLYLFVDGKPTGPIAIKGLKSRIARARIVGEGTILEPRIFNKLYWSEAPGIEYIDIPEDRLDPNTTVIAILLEEPIELYTE